MSPQSNAARDKRRQAAKAAVLKSRRQQLQRVLARSRHAGLRGKRWSSDYVVGSLLGVQLQFRLPMGLSDRQARRGYQPSSRLACHGGHGPWGMAYLVLGERRGQACTGCRGGSGASGAPEPLKLSLGSAWGAWGQACWP